MPRGRRAAAVPVRPAAGWRRTCAAAVRAAVCVRPAVPTVAHAKRSAARLLHSVHHLPRVRVLLALVRQVEETLSQLADLKNKCVETLQYEQCQCVEESTAASRERTHLENDVLRFQLPDRLDVVVEP